MNTRITRREFVAGVACAGAACAAIAGKLTAQETDAAKNENLVAPCGLYCGACTAIRAGSGAKKSPMGNMTCNGCLGGGQLTAHASQCAIRECAINKSKTRRCSECPEFPCSLITDFNNHGVPHHAEVLENLRQLQTMGITDWTKHEENRWRCSKCQTMLSWYDAECPDCKNSRSDKLFPLGKPFGKPKVTAKS